MQSHVRRVFSPHPPPRAPPPPRVPLRGRFPIFEFGLFYLCWAKSTINTDLSTDFKQKVERKLITTLYELFRSGLRNQNIIRVQFPPSFLVFFGSFLAGDSFFVANYFFRIVQKLKNIECQKIELSGAPGLFWWCVFTFTFKLLSKHYVFPHKHLTVLGSWSGMWCFSLGQWLWSPCSPRVQPRVPPRAPKIRKVYRGSGFLTLGQRWSPPVSPPRPERPGIANFK